MEINSSCIRERGMMVINNDRTDDDHDNHQQLELPPGFRFHPTDEELITHYLSPKMIDAQFNPVAIGEVDLNKVEPWDLPRKAKMGEKEWYFFCVKDRKYPTGLRTNRATEAGYWKATGKDKEIFRGKALVGMKKTLVFYTGRAPKGHKTNWVMHEYRSEGGRSSSSNKYNSTSLLKSSKDDWVICRVFNKGSTIKKVPSPGLFPAGRMTMIDADTDTDSQYDGGGGAGSGGSDLHDEHHHLHHHPSFLPGLPPLMDSSPGGPFERNPSSVRQEYYRGPSQPVSCFSTTAAAAAMEEELGKSLQKQSGGGAGFQVNTVANRDYFNAAAAAMSCSSSVLHNSPTSYGMNQAVGSELCGQHPFYFQQDQSSALRMLLDGNYGSGGADYYAFGAAAAAAGSSGTADTTTVLSGGGGGGGGGGSYTDMSSGGENNVVDCNQMIRRNNYQPQEGGQNNNSSNSHMNLPHRHDSASSVDLDCLLNF